MVEQSSTTKEGPAVWRPAEETDRVRAAADGLGALRLARREPGMAGEIGTGLVVAVVAALAVWGLNALLSMAGDAGWTIIFRGLAIVLVAGVLFGVVYALRALFRPHLAVYVYDLGVVGAARGRTRMIRWDQATQVVVLATQGVHVVADGRPMIIPATVVGNRADDRAEFLNAVVPPVEQRGVEVLRF